MIDPQIEQYIRENILPRYAEFDKAHNIDHAQMVIEQSMQLARYYAVNKDMVYIIAAYHDLGLCAGRQFHHKVSAEILMSDDFISSHFDLCSRQIMSEAIEDHRASSDHDPRSIYGMIVAEADRVISVEITMSRTVQYGLKHHPTLDFEQQYLRFKEHLEQKYAHGGYLKLWIKESDNAARLEELRAIINDPALLSTHFKRIYEREVGLD